MYLRALVQLVWLLLPTLKPAGCLMVSLLDPILSPSILVRACAKQAKQGGKVIVVIVVVVVVARTEEERRRKRNTETD